MTPLRLAATAFVLAWLGTSGVAAAQVSVTLDGCAALSALDVTRALELELDAVPETELRIRVACDARGVLLEVEDALTDKRLARRVPQVDARRESAVRTVALLVSQLVFASWAELLWRPSGQDTSPAEARALASVERSLAESRGAAGRTSFPTDPPRPDDAPDTASPATTPPTSTTREVPVSAAPLPSSPSLAPPSLAPPSLAPLSASNPPTTRPDSRARPAGSSMGLALDVAAGARIRDVAAPFLTGIASFEGLARVKNHTSLGARVSVEYADIARLAGSVSYSAVGAGAVLRHALVRHAPLSLDASAGLHAAWVRLDGRPSRTSVEGRAVDDLLVEVELAIRSGFLLGPVRFGLSLSLGATLLGTIGTVSGEPDITLPGVFAGLGLAIGVREESAE
jgi:hypothetical protein